jgi:hypothetical protein
MLLSTLSAALTGVFRRDLIFRQRLCHALGALLFKILDHFRRLRGMMRRALMCENPASFSMRPMETSSRSIL